MPNCKNKYGLTWKDIQHDIACLEGIISFEEFLDIVDLLGGSNIYIPTRETLETPTRNKLIRDEYNGYNRKALARKHHVTERTIASIVRNATKF